MLVLHVCGRVVHGRNLPAAALRGCGFGAHDIPSLIRA
jgi:hypothetical protein